MTRHARQGVLWKEAKGLRLTSTVVPQSWVPKGIRSFGEQDDASSFDHRLFLERTHFWEMSIEHASVKFSVQEGVLIGEGRPARPHTWSIKSSDVSGFISPSWYLDILSSNLLARGERTFCVVLEKGRKAGIAIVVSLA